MSRAAGRVNTSQLLSRAALRVIMCGAAFLAFNVLEATAQHNTTVTCEPIVWVAEGRNANYPSRAACDSGHHSIDTCDHNDVQYSFPVAADRNIGSRQRPAAEGGCIAGTQLNSLMVVRDVVECFWRPEVRFRGWQDSSAGVTGYFRYLQHLGVAT